jgi:hypothetical protein
MSAHHTFAATRIRRSALALGLGAALALGSSGGIAVAQTSAFPMRRDGAPLLENLQRRAGDVQRVRRDAPHPNGGIVIPVTSCADDGSDGTLRHAVLVASNGDTVDMSSLTCSTITLADGSINVDVDDLDIVGPGASALTIDAAGASRVIRHAGAGEIGISNVTLAHGYYAAPPVPVAYGGGCLYSHGTVSLDGVVVTSCTSTADFVAVGGGITAVNGIVMFYSTISGNSAIATIGVNTTSAVGGGVISGAQLVVEHSTISGNVATTAYGNAYAGGAFAPGSVVVKYSTFSANTASTVVVEGTNHYGIGGALAASAPFIQNSTFEDNTANAAGGVYLLSATVPATLVNSTISGNHVSLIAGGLLSSDGDVRLHNSTIAFNESGFRGGGGMVVNSSSAEIVSSIIANNSPSGPVAAADLDGSAIVTGSHNLIKISGLDLPADTITLDPQLGALAWNGGETRTHSIPATSPAHEAGIVVDTLNYDQRGLGYPRVDATDPDIGAYELNADVIFVDGFGTG